MNCNPELEGSAVIQWWLPVSVDVTGAKVLGPLDYT